MENENVQNPQLNLAVVSSRTFFDDIDRHFECMKNEDYVKASHKFEKGRKLWLEVEVEESEMTTWLFKWLYGKDKDGNNNIPFGCKLETIHFKIPTGDEIKRKLIELAESI